MNTFDQIKVQKLNNTNDDLFVVNTARVSFGAWHHVLEPSDTRLINYLASNQHTSPFRHVRETFEFHASVSNVMDIKSLTSFERAGLVNDKTRIRHSLFGWFNLLKNDRVNQYYVKTIIGHLVDKYPLSCAAFGLGAIATDSKIPSCHLYSGIEINPEFKDVSYRITAPVTVARQAVKHQVGMSWNECSRRYVHSNMEFFNQEFRLRPDASIKQGSGEPTLDVPLVKIGDQEATIDQVMSSLMRWYDDAVNPNGFNIAPETARGYLPLNMLTTWIWTGNLTAWRHFMSLRDESHAQLEIQDLARKLNVTDNTAP